MKKYMLMFFLIVFFSVWMHANDYMVVGELFSSLNCQYCPAAQAGLENLFTANPGRVIPIVYYPAPHTFPRREMYALSSATPISVFGGTSRFSGATNVDAVFADFYDTMSERIAPLSIVSDISFTTNGLIEVSADIVMLDDITASENEVSIHFFLTLDDGAGVEQSRFFVVGYKSQIFELRDETDTDSYIETFVFNPNWNLAHLRAVVLVQSNTGTAHPPPTFNERYILQANMTQLSGDIVSFATDIVSGPPSLRVNFSDRSMTTETIESWEWDFGDGSPVATEQYPTHIYTTTGSYDVKLTITTSSRATLEQTFSDFINVQPSHDVFGTVAGIWTAENSPYIITESIEIPSGLSLDIEAGVTIAFDDDLSMTVHGNLTVSGGANDRVIFTADDGWGGIDIREGETAVEISYALFENSNATVLNATGRNIVVEYTDFIHNFGGSGATAISLQNASNSSIVGSYFANNTGNTSSATSCGAITLTQQSVLTIKNSIIVNNTGRAAGAIRLANSSIVNIENCTIFNNQHTNTTAGGTILNNNSTVNMINSITNGSPVIRNTSGTNNVTFTRIIGTTGEGNILTEPRFENATTSIGFEALTKKEAWVLSIGSPGIDAGNPDPMFNDVDDPTNTGFALFPARGTIRNDMGAFGGAGFQLDDGATSENEIDMPTQKTALSIAAYPNPFNPNVNINVEIQDTKKVLNVSVYNIKGQKIYQIMDEIPTDNKISLTWNGTDSAGKPLASGIYFISATNQTENSVKKVVLLK
jgi:PKD repeat protein